MTIPWIPRIVRSTLLAGLLASATVLSAPIAAADPEPVLGTPFIDGAIGYGTARPEELSQGGTCGGDVILKITWDSWGGPTASGRGVKCLTAGEAAEGQQPERVALTASDLGPCHGKLAYRTLAVGASSPDPVCR